MSEPVGPPPPAPHYVYAPPAGYAPPPQGYGPWTPQQLPPMPAVPTARAAGGSALGIVAFVLGLIAAVGASIVAAVAGFQIGIGTGDQLATQLAPAGADFDFSLLSPVREWVLLAEVSFWVGTVLGVWAIVQGIVAIAKNRGRGWGITAVVIAVAGPVIYGVALWGLFATGIASSATPLGV